MDSPIVTVTWQSGILSAISNILGQAISCYQSNKSFALNLTDLVNFVLFAILSTPPNFFWQRFLEEQFPGYTEPTEKPHDRVTPAGKTNNAPRTKQLNIRNTAIKFALDQTLGAAVNTLLFLGGMALLRGQSWHTAAQDCREQFWPIIFAGQKLWPAVSVLNFVLVPVEYRMMVGGVVGLFWGVYLSLVTASEKVG